MYQYRIISVDANGKRKVEMRALSDRDVAISRFHAIRDRYTFDVDVYIERREILPWERYEPKVPVNQDELPI